MLRATSIVVLVGLASATRAETIRVPQTYKTIQAAVDAAQPGDTVLVAAGRYAERIRLKPGVTLRSTGDKSPDETGWKRAQATVLDGGGSRGERPGVEMAEGSTLDGFSITNVGTYDQAVWQEHFDSRGETLGDDEGAVQAEGTVAAISIRGVDCTVKNNIVHHNGDVGIAVTGDDGRRGQARVIHNIARRNMGGGIGVAEGAEAVVRDNVCHENLRAGIGCRRANPLILDNRCFGNIRAGIGCREGARPVIRGNQCYQNRRAGIGIRMAGTAPVVESNECYENDLAGIGCRDLAEPVIRDNVCHHNRMAGIGCDGSLPFVVGNTCRENARAGIGLQGGAKATVLNNKCVENGLVAIGVTHGSEAHILGNELMRTGKVPPLVAVKDGSTATLQSNRIVGGGVAALLVQGKVSAHDNSFLGQGGKQGNCVWVWEGSTVSISKNDFDGYRTAVHATKSTVTILDNRVQNFSGPAIFIKDSVQPAHALGNSAISHDENADVVEIQGAAGVVADNRVIGPNTDDRLHQSQ